MFHAARRLSGVCGAKVFTTVSKQRVVGKVVSRGRSEFRYLLEHRDIGDVGLNELRMRERGIRAINAEKNDACAGEEKTTEVAAALHKVPEGGDGIAQIYHMHSVRQIRNRSYGARRPGQHPSGITGHWGGISRA